MTTQLIQPSQPSAPSIARPLLGGYALVAVALAWLAGIALRPVGPLPLIPAAGMDVGLPARAGRGFGARPLERYCDK